MSEMNSRFQCKLQEPIFVNICLNWVSLLWHQERGKKGRKMAFAKTKKTEHVDTVCIQKKRDKKEEEANNIP